MGIILRIPAFVIGDGIHTIKELINIQNLDRCSKTQLFCNDICNNKDKILEKDKKYFINNVSNYAKGGTIHIVDLKNVHEDIFDLCNNIYNKINVNLFGIDFICTDINKSLEKQKCAINEFELYNDIDIHYITNDNVFRFYKVLLIKWIIILIIIILIIFFLINAKRLD